MPRQRADRQRAIQGCAGLSADYPSLLADIKQRIRAAQVRATLRVNQELICLYWDIGRVLTERQTAEGWGSKVISRLAVDLRNELPEVKGFSRRNLLLMTRFYREYSGQGAIVQQPVAQLPAPQDAGTKGGSVERSLPLPEARCFPLAILQDGEPLIPQLPWGHNVLLMQKIKDLPIRLWYMQQTLAQGWSRNILAIMIDSQVHRRQGRATTNFAERLPTPQSDLARQALKDPYIFDFLTLEEPFHERELETGLLIHVQKFLLELGRGFAFVGRQHHLEVGDEDFYIDLLFYHLHLRCFIVIDLKKGPFKAEYAGKMNFYCNIVDARLRHATDQPTMGLILCQDRSRLVAEYALKGMKKAIGVSEYRLTRALPRQLQSSLPSIEQIEAELSRITPPAPGRKQPKAARRAKP